MCIKHCARIQLWTIQSPCPQGVYILVGKKDNGKVQI